MILDYQNLFSSDQAITASAVSTNVVSLGTEAADGSGRKIVIVVTETFATLTSLAIKLQADSVAAMSSAVDVLTTQAFAAAELVAGKTIEIPIPALEQEAFARLSYVVAGSNATAGKVDAFIALDTQTNSNQTASE